MRLFIAVKFNPSTLSRLTELRDELRSRAERGNFSRDENLHLTLAFLGECNSNQTSAVKAAMDSLVFEPFDMMIDRVGRFKRDSGDIWWASGEPPMELLTLQRELTDKLITTGFELDERKYTPHITLGREVVTDATPWHFEPFGETVSRIDLMKSERISGKLTYTAIYSKGCTV